MNRSTPGLPVHHQLPEFTPGEGLVGFVEPFSFFSIIVWGLDLDYCNTEWFALETNRDHSVVFEIASKYRILDSFLDFDGYSISSKEFMPIVVDNMVI